LLCNEDISYYSDYNNVKIYDKESINLDLSKYNLIIYHHDKHDCTSESKIIKILEHNK